MVALASAVLAAITVTLLLSIPFLAEIEEARSIIVASEDVQLTRVIFGVALPHALVLGLPLFVILRSMRRQVGVLACALGGFLVGAVPIGLFILWSAMEIRTNGVTTPACRIEDAQGVGFWGLLGMAGGLSFWGAMRVSGQMADTPNQSEAHSSRSLAGSLSIVFGAVLLTCAIIVLPSVVRDNSCHNLFRDRQIGIDPQISARIKLSPADWPTLRQIFADFGAAHSLAFRSDEPTRRGKILWSDLNLCNESGINIDALDRTWPPQNNFPHADRDIELNVFDLDAGSDWKPLGRDLLNMIDITLPQKTTILGPDGKAISIEEALKGRH
jgi:hypothetical protein